MVSAAVERLTRRVERALARAEESDDPQGLGGLLGMSGLKVRLFLNDLCDHPDARYLEVGVLGGSTLISAAAGSQAPLLVGIDNWSQFVDGGRQLTGMHPRDFLLGQLEARVPGWRERLRLIDGDCFTLPPGALDATFNVYFYDGDHAAEAQARSLGWALPALEAAFVWVVDDFARERVREATDEALRTSGCRRRAEWVIGIDGHNDARGWWNGLYVAVLEHAAV